MGILTSNTSPVVEVLAEGTPIVPTPHYPRLPPLRASSPERPAEEPRGLVLPLVHVGSPSRASNFDNLVNQVSSVHRLEVEELRTQLKALQRENTALRRKASHAGQVQGSCSLRQWAGSGDNRRSWHPGTPAHNQDAPGCNSMEIFPKCQDGPGCNSMEMYPSCADSQVLGDMEQHKSHIVQDRCSIGKMSELTDEDSEAIPGGLRCDSPKAQSAPSSPGTSTSDGNMMSSKSTSRISRRFVALPIWLVGSAAEEGDNLDFCSTTTGAYVKMSRTMTDNGTKHAAWWISYPGSLWRLFYDLFGGMLIMLDLIRIPWYIAFDPEKTTFGFALDYFTLTFWTANIPATLTVGYTERGETIMDPKRIAMNYMRTWCILDLLIILPDWIFLLIASAEESGTAGKSFELMKVMRLFRLVRLVRLARLRRLAQNIHQFLDSEHLTILMNVVHMMVVLLLTNHLICCVWFMIGKANGSESWIKDSGINLSGWEEGYAVAFHWAITQFTPSSMPVQPVSLSERVFAISVTLFGVIGFSYVVGSISGSLAQLRTTRENTARQFWMLRRYLKQEHVSRVMVTRIERYVEYQWMRQRENIPVQKVELMVLLSEQLKMELKSEILLPRIRVVAFVHQLCKVSRVTVIRLVSDATQRLALATHDTLFTSREAARWMSIVTHGKLNYTRVFNSKEIPEDVMGMEDWLAECVLWTRWFHMGEAVAVEESELLQVEPKKFGDIVNLIPQAFEVAQNYSANFLVWLNDQPASALSDIILREEVAPLLWNLRGFESVGDSWRRSVRRSF